MQRHFIMTLMFLLGISVFVRSSIAKEWVIFDEQLPQGAELIGPIEVTKGKTFEGKSCLKYTGGGLTWSSVIKLNFDLSGIVYDDAFLEFYAFGPARATLEIRLLGQNDLPDMGSRVHPTLDGAIYQQIKISLRHFLNRSTAEIPKTLDAFTGGNNIVDQFKIAATDGPVYIDNARIADTEEMEENHAVSLRGKLVTFWGRLKTSR